MNLHEDRAANQLTPDAPEDLPLAEHLVPLPDQSWAMWRWVGLRGAGFPADHLLSLAAPACGAAADGILQAEAEERQAQQAAVDAVNAALDTLRREDQWADLGRREPLVQALRLLKQGKLPAVADGDAFAPLIEAIKAARDRVDRAWAEFHAAFETALLQTGQAIQELAQRNDVREAITWQNRHALHTAINLLLREPTARRGSQQRQHEQLLASYVQRYCAKNDTIGFFGPLGWARFVDSGAALSARPGPGLLATRTVCYESWCIDTLARKISDNPALLPWATPRRMPTLHLDGTTLYQPFEMPLHFSADEAAVLQACDGSRMAKELAAHVIRDAANSLTSEQEVYSILAYLRDMGVIVWAFEVPFELYPERTLQRLLERIEDERLRQQALAALSELNAARKGVAQAAGDPDRLNRALGDLDATFTRLTGAAATRAHGKMYAARTLVYEDCRRDIETELGPEIVDALGPPLGLLLTSGRWCTFQLAAICRQEFQRLYAELTRALRSPVVDLATFWTRAQMMLFDENQGPMARITRLFQQRWADLLDLPAGQRQVTYRSDDVRARVQEVFAAPNSGWLSARHHSPDLMIAAEGIDAIRRGDYQFVMGELHIAFNTLAGSCFLSQHPCPEDLFLALELDFPETRLVPIIPRTWTRMTSRTRMALVSPTDYRLVLTHDSGGIPKSRALPIGALVVEQAGADLVVRTRDGRLSFDLIETFGLMLSVASVNTFQILPPSSYKPRVSIDRLVVSRESWNMTPSAIDFAFEKDPARRFVAARRWAESHGMPREVFVKSPVEVKPFYVSFDSPIYVDILAKVVRRTIEQHQQDATIGVTEMLPSLNQLWLPDAAGRRYTSELRIVAVDLAAMPEPDPAVT